MRETPFDDREIPGVEPERRVREVREMTQPEDREYPHGRVEDRPFQEINTEKERPIADTLTQVGVPG